MLFNQMVILAIIQGLTEFVPVSSSGHLIVISRILHWPDQGLYIDVALHFGTLLAVMVYFWHDLWMMIGGFFNLMLRRANYHGKLAMYLIVATIPAVICGIILSSLISTHMRSMSFIGGTTIVFGILLHLADTHSRHTKNLSNMSYIKAILIGLAQALALMPGVSRSGICMSMARWLGFNRIDAARFAFLMSIPVIIGACVHTAYKMQFNPQLLFNQNVITSVSIAFIVGLITIRCMLGWLNNHSFKFFMIYRIILGSGLLVYANI